MYVEVVTIPKDELVDLIDRAVHKAVESVLNPPDEIMSKAELAKYLKRSPATITRLMKKGLPYRGPGRPTFKRSDVDRWLSLN